MSADYVHGFEADEQTRLVAQAAHWRERLILPGLAYGAGERVLDLGCGAGAVLGVLGQAFPGVRLAGVDREPRQLEAARAHLASNGLEADLRVSDATATPFEDASVDHAFCMWIVEHLDEPAPLFAEALRVLRPGGTITLVETDYELFVTQPDDADVRLLVHGQCELFTNPAAGRALGTGLRAAGFAAVRVDVPGYHHFDDGTGSFRAHVDYVASYVGPLIEPMVERLGLDRTRLERGLAFLRALPDHTGGALTQIVHRASARKPG